MGNRFSKSKNKKQQAVAAPLSISEPTFKTEYTPAFAVEKKRERDEKLRREKEAQLAASGAKAKSPTKSSSKKLSSAQSSSSSPAKKASPIKPRRPAPATGDKQLDDVWMQLDELEDAVESERVAGDSLNESMTMLEEEMFGLKLLTDEDAREREYREVTALRKVIEVDNPDRIDICVVSGTYDIDSERVELVLREKKQTYGIVIVPQQADLSTAAQTSKRPQWLEEQFSSADTKRFPLFRDLTKRFGGLRATVEYLDKQFSHAAPMLNSTDVWEWVDKADRGLGAAFLQYLTNTSTSMDAKLKSNLYNQIKIFNDALKGPMFAGEKPSFVDIAYYTWFERFAALEYFKRYNFPVADFPKIVKWLTTLRERPSIATYQFEPQQFCEWIESVTKPGPGEAILLLRHAIKVGTRRIADEIPKTLTTKALKKLQKSFTELSKVTNQYEALHSDIELSFPQLAVHDTDETTLDEWMEDKLLQLCSYSSATDSGVSDLVTEIKSGLKKFNKEFSTDSHFLVPLLRSSPRDLQSAVLRRAFDVNRLNEYRMLMPFLTESLTDDEQAQLRACLKEALGDTDYEKFAALFARQPEPEAKPQPEASETPQKVKSTPSKRVTLNVDTPSTPNSETKPAGRRRVTYSLSSASAKKVAQQAAEQNASENVKVAVAENGTPSGSKRSITSTVAAADTTPVKKTIKRKATQ